MADKRVVIEFVVREDAPLYRDSGDIARSLNMALDFVMIPESEEYDGALAWMKANVVEYNDVV